MSTTPELAVDTPSAVVEIADLARRDATRTPEFYDLTPDSHLVVTKLRSDERIEQLDLERHLPDPNRARGTVTVHDWAHFAEYVNRIGHANHTSVWANVQAGTVTAVINDHANCYSPGWRDHTVTLALQPDPDWQLWHQYNGKKVSQEDFAEFIERTAHTIVHPDAATMREISTTMTAKRGVDFHQGTRLQTGEIQLRYEETTQATAGTKGDIEIPEAIRVRIAPWMSVDPVELDARFRWRIPNRQLALGYELLRSDIAQRQAFAGVVETLRDQLRDDMPVYLGTPPASIRPRS